MKDKTLFDAASEVLPAEEPQSHFPSYEARCRPIQAWLEARFGPCVLHSGTWRYLEWRVHGVHIRIALEADRIEWCVGFGIAGTKRVGWTAYDGWEQNVPPAVHRAAAHVAAANSP